MNTINCVVCAQNLKRVKAAVWGGYVLKIDNEEKMQIAAGYCGRHKNEPLPHLKHLGPRHCVGIWTPDMGRENLV
jgi:hypothetical protein